MNYQPEFSLLNLQDNTQISYEQRLNKTDIMDAADNDLAWYNHRVSTRDLRSFVIRFDFESYVRFEIRFVLMVRFETLESSTLSIVIRKETIGGG